AAGAAGDPRAAAAQATRVSYRPPRRPGGGGALQGVGRLPATRRRSDRRRPGSRVAARRDGDRYLDGGMSVESNMNVNGRGTGLAERAADSDQTILVAGGAGY